MKHHKMKTLISAVGFGRLCLYPTWRLLRLPVPREHSVLFNAYESVSGYSFALDTVLHKNDIIRRFKRNNFQSGFLKCRTGRPSYPRLALLPPVRYQVEGKLG